MSLETCAQSPMTYVGDDVRSLQLHLEINQRLLTSSPTLGFLKSAPCVVVRDHVVLKRVLIISPRFPPSNAPDHQRVRMALSHFTEFGWEATVLAVRPECIEGGAEEPLLSKSLPKGLRVERVSAVSPRLTRRAGLGSLSLRAWRSLARRGGQLLREQKFDLVFFSTTEFPLMALGPRWRSKDKVPYVLDIQDPWVSDYYQDHPKARPPGGKIKYGISQWVARRLEAKTITNSAHVVCVSPSYPAMFLRRYRHLTPEQFSELPFCAAESDLGLARSADVSQPIFDPADGKQHWVYAGRGGCDMSFSLRGFFHALRRATAEDPDLVRRLRIHFVGTDYAPGRLARKTIEPVAQECGVESMVTEHPNRLPYFQALRCLCDANALIVPGSDDPAYTASKLYPYILARKPLLAIFHKNSSVVEVLRRTQAGTVVTFNGEPDPGSLSEEVYRQWFARWPIAVPQTDWKAFEPYTAREMTRRLCAVFDKAASEQRR
jgi:hypothetical protein